MSRIRKSTLSNGIKVITEEVGDVESVALGVWVKTGSRYESERIGGISHFIEHLLFKGTKERSALDISREIESVGGVLNAFTGREYTCFYSKVLSANLPLAKEILADMFINSVFDPDELEREKKVVLQEIKMVEDTPDDLIHDVFAETFWKNERMGASVLGLRKSVSSITRADIKSYMRSHYHPDSVFITAAGNLKHNTVVRALEATFGSIACRRPRRAPRVPSTKPGITLVKRDLEQVHLCLGVPTAPQSSSDRYKLYLMNTILGGGMSSRLFQEIREKRGLAYSVYSYLNLCLDTGALIVYAGTSAESMKEVVSLILEIFDGLGDFTEEELSNAKDHLKGAMILGLESTSSRMMKMARDEIYYRRPVPVSEIIKNIDRVKASDIKETVEALLKPEKITLTAIGKAGRRDIPAGLKRLH